ncbi:MAG TPA: pyridoxamine 5'-phosphate oxidase family protein [Puia sp.]|nr:pyridoxamine 5'-phosphate oxidase family protein [Puia sp.]
MEAKFLYDFIKRHSLAVLSAVNKENKPESALVGIAVSPKLEIIFDTVKHSRKYPNLVIHPNVSLVIGWNDETTLQFEGKAIELGNSKNDEEFREIYYEVYPDGRNRAANWPGIVHFVVQPKWIRYSNYNEPVTIEEMKF